MPLPRSSLSIDRLGSVAGVVMALALVGAPFMTFRANRIVSGEARDLFHALPALPAAGLTMALLAVAGVAILVRRPVPRLLAAAGGLSLTVLAAGWAAGFLIPAGNSFARVSPAYGFWILAGTCALLIADALTRLRPGPWMRLVALALTFGALGLLLLSGAWDRLSIMREYAARADSFWREGGQHLQLALGSLAVAIAIGLPLGLLCHRVRALREAVLQGLSIVQTIPSIALFGLLMVPLGALSAHVPLAARLGIHGIGAAPAFLALVLYSLLPVVANTVSGLAGVPAAAVDAARGMGMSRRQRLAQVELPLALPVILAGIRVVLVQNLGLATVAALIGGGGFGTFVFQGLGQSAIDLVLLGALPTIALSFAAAVILDALIDLARGGRR